ncbi:MAG: diaminopimelate decarboxylase, partial [Clostridia bacterium]|nr:diaminopimelate decarboxylase [Clostridia bacterium]
MICENISYLADGTLAFAGISVKKLAQEYGTPLYLLDADRIRNNCKIFAEAFSQLFPAGSLPLYAGKANCISAIYPIVREAGLGIDVVSSGEIYTALHAGFPMEKAFFHGNNKTDEDLRYALDSGVGVIVVDGEDELKALNTIAHEKGKKQPILLRITPGIDPHTYEAVTTGKVDSKFGSAIATGEAARMVSLALDSDALLLEGFHCHVGSQVFGEDVFERSVAIMIGFMAEIRDRFGYEAGILDLGGGFGVRYTAEDPVVSVRDRLVSLSGVLKKECEHHGLKAPAFMMEPGRSIVADAGMTVYTVGSVKKIPGAKNYVSVDGGMTDNPRYALYRSR